MRRVPPTNARTDVDEASRKLREFQEKHKLIDISEQSRASLTAMASLQGELISKQMQLDYLDGFSAGDEANALQLKRQIAVVKERLGSLEGATAPTSPAGAAPSGMLPSLLEVPRLRYEYEQLYRDQEVQETVFLLLTRLFEVAKVNEARDTSAFTVLDPPVVATHKSRPRTLVILGIDTCGALQATRRLRVTMAPPVSFKYALFSTTDVQLKNNYTICGDVYAAQNFDVGNNNSVLAATDPACGGTASAAAES